MQRLWVFAILLVMALGFANAQDTSQSAGTSQAPNKIGVNGVTTPVLIFGADPDVPGVARERDLDGQCVVSLIVDAKGNPQNIRIIRCTDTIFAQSSLNAVATYRFKPATKAGQPVAVYLSVEVNFHIGDRTIPRGEPKMQFSYEVRSPPGAASSGPDAHGVYPLTAAITPPKLNKFSDEAFGEAALGFAGNSACDVVLTIDEKGKSLDAEAPVCEKRELVKPALDSLLKSRYKAGSLNGKAVPVRVSIHLAFAGYAPAS